MHWIRRDKERERVRDDVPVGADCKRKLSS